MAPANDHFGVVIRAERPEEPGLDLVVVHGLLTPSLPRLHSNWSTSLLEISPDNTTIISYDANLRISGRFQWKDIQSNASILINALQSWTEETAATRILVIASIGVAGVIVKHALYRFSQESRYRECSAKIRGLLFFGTPHFVESNAKNANALNGIIRYESSSSRWPSNVTKDDFSSLVYSAWGFDELKLNCKMLCCYECVPMKTSGLVGGFVSGFSMRSFTMVDEKMTAIKSKHVETFPIDTKLSMLLEGTNCVIHRQASEFLHRVLLEERDENRKSPPSPVDVVTPESLGSHALLVSSRSESPGSGNVPYSFSPNTNLSVSPSATSGRVPDRSCKLPSRQRSSFQTMSTSNDLTFSSVSDQGFVVLSKVENIKNFPTIPDVVEWIQVGACRQPNPDFRGRADLIKQMEDRLLQLSETELANISRPNAYVICGAAGLGKTQAALHFFHSYKSQFDVRLWIHANSRENLFTAFKEISARLGLESRAECQDTVLSRELVKGWLMEPFQNFRKKDGKLMRWLLVIDNADNPDDVLDFWPYDGQGSIIITSRNRGAMTQNYFGDCGAELSVLSDDDAVVLLKRLLERNRRPTESSDLLQRAVAKLGYWPLAIAKMAVIMQRQKLSLFKFLEIYESREHRFNYHSARVGNLHGGYTLTLTAAWALEDMSQGAAQLLSVISLLAPESIPEEILTKAPEKANLPGYPLDSGAYSREIEAIEARSIISQQIGENAYDPVDLSIHPLIQEVVRGQLLKNDDEVVSVFNAAIGLIAGVWPFETLPFYGYHDFDRVERREQCDKLLPHTTQLIRFYESLPEEPKRKCITVDLLNILSEIAWYQYQRSNMDDSLKYIHLVLKILENDPDGHPQIRAGQFGTWGNIAMVMNQPGLSLQKNLEALEIREKMFAETGVVNSQLAASYTETARSMMMNNMFDKAKGFIKKSIEVRKQMPQFSRLQLYSPLYYLSLIHLHEGEYEKAASLALEALREREIQFGRDDRENKRTGLLLICLGNIYGKQGLHEESFEYHQRALTQLRAAGGEDDLDTANAYYKMASQYLRDNDFDLARSAIERAIQGLQRSRFHKGEVARAMFLQARIFSESGQGDAAATLRKSVDIRRQLTENDTRAPEVLKESDFDELVVIWRR